MFFLYNETDDPTVATGQIITSGADAADIFLSGTVVGQTHEH